MSKTFTKLTELNECILGVDALNLAFRWKQSGSINFAEDYKRTIESFKNSYKAKWVVIMADKGSSSYRKAIYPEYKQNRKEKFAQQTDAERAEFEVFFEDYEKALQLIRDTTDYPVLQFEQTEADDIGAYVCSILPKLKAKEMWLLSTDRDWDLLLANNISRFSYVTRKEYTLDNWNTHYDFPHEHYISIKCLQGDAGDNVLGVEGIGIKRAVDLVNRYGSALDIVAALPISSKLKYIQALNGSADRIFLNYQLMDLVSFCRDALGDTNINHINNVLESYIK